MDAAATYSCPYSGTHYEKVRSTVPPSDVKHPSAYTVKRTVNGLRSTHAVSVVHSMFSFSTECANTPIVRSMTALSADVKLLQ